MLADSRPSEMTVPESPKFDNLQVDDTQPMTAFDELLDTEGRIGSSWQFLIDSVEAMGGNELRRRQRKAMELLRDDGATYHAYNGNQAQFSSAQWRMDLLPWVISSEEWRDIETGLLERAELFNLLLEDLYGERSVIARGIVPPEIVFGHRGFLRAAQGIRMPGEQQLITHATDLVRRSDGSLCVLGDRTQVPSGAGYALENRIVTTRILPSVFRDSNVHRLSGYFQSLRGKLLSLAPHVSSPTIAILTPGTLNETYFEHAYLANYLGFELVQGADLSVRRNALWMQTVNGWSQVHVLLRRVDDDYCDPVELRDDSQLGIPGLMEVVRAGNVVIANPIGSGVLESPAFLAYLPEISRHFLGRDLQLPSAKTWWCGDPDSFAHVVEHLEDMIIKPVYKSPGSVSIAPADLDEDDRTALLSELVSKPAYYAAQERITPSHLPTVGPEALVPRPAVLRAFAVASGSSYRLMPGGLTRIGVKEHSSQISNQSGSISKDTWIVASEPQGDADSKPVSEQLHHAATLRTTDLPKRVVENMFWFGRYAERAEFGLRMTRTLLLQSADIGSTNDIAQQALLNAVITASDSWQSLEKAGVEPVMPQRSQILPVVLDPQRRESLIGSIEAMLTCAEETKELMTFDTQRVINQIREEAGALVADLEKSMYAAPEDVLNPVLTSLLALSGILHENVNRGTGWHFLDLGRRLERGIQSAREVRYLLGKASAPEREYFALEALLISTENLVFYRRTYQGQLDLRNVLELLLLDQNNPRGLLFQLKRLNASLESLPNPEQSSGELGQDARHLLEATSLLQLSHLEDLCFTDTLGQQRLSLIDNCRQIEALLDDVAIALSEAHFEQPIMPQQLLRPQRELEA